MFKDKIKYLRELNNMTQEEFSQKVHVTRTAVSKWENGKGYPSLDSLKDISVLFNVSIDDLISEDQDVSFFININNKTNSSVGEKIRFALKCFLTILKQDWIKSLLVVLYSVHFLGLLLLGDSYLSIDMDRQYYMYMAGMYIASVRVLQLQLEARLRVPQNIAFCFSLLFTSCYFGFMLIIILLHG